MAWEEKCSFARRMWRTVEPSSSGEMVFVMVSNVSPPFGFQDSIKLLI